jgi:hypothetical protein
MPGIKPRRSQTRRSETRKSERLKNKPKHIPFAKLITPLITGNPESNNARLQRSRAIQGEHNRVIQNYLRQRNHGSRRSGSRSGSARRNSRHR